MLHGVLAAAATPLRNDGTELDDEAIAPYVEFLADGGLDGLLALGTTGEGILLTVEERRRAARLFLEAAGDRLQVAVHCGAQTTADTVLLAADAAELGAAAVAVIGPPYYAFDAAALVRHFAAAAEACRPLPFYLYEFRARTGYSIPLTVVEQLRELAPNLAGLKVSNAPFDAVEPYLLEGLDVFVGAESLVLAGLERGAAGAVSGLAAAYPELVVALVRDRTGDVGETRAALERFPFQAAVKHVLGRRGLPLQPDVRAPLRALSDEERQALDAWLESS
ncbi:MAG TPA: dihydrodipicolinate synthase family protein [Gaiellaceae bacterium]|jgi:dihydrodipicolinate synthase/N-acetylneuraminate lyase|nr:dihydrodipicolinate synthase family protein [Gaiellaceae bacterium]